MQILDGTAVASHIKAALKAETEQIFHNGDRSPHLAAILVGDNPASQAYVSSKVRTCDELGYTSTMIRMEASVQEQTLLEEIYKLNENDQVDGILVQLPLPPHIDEQKVILAINPAKDVDGFHPISQGNMLLGQPGFLPATPYGILLLLEYYNLDLSGKHCVVVGRSNIVGTPMSVLLSRNAPGANATVTLCHSRTKDLKSYTLQADMIVAAIGKPGFITEDLVAPGAIIIDVGINRIEDKSRKSGYRLVGDVDYDKVAPKSGFITPVPKGVGPMTICGLMKNTMKAHQLRTQH